MTPWQQHERLTHVLHKMCCCNTHHLPKLQHCMLFAARRVIRTHIRHAMLPPKQVGTLPVYVQGLPQGLPILKGVQTPSQGGLFCLGWFVVRHHYTIDGVGLLCELSRQPKITFWFLVRILLFFSPRFTIVCCWWWCILVMS